MNDTPTAATATAPPPQGKPLKKMGLKAQDTCELFFEDLFVPDEGLLGQEDKGFYYLMDELAQVFCQFVPTHTMSTFINREQLGC